MKTDREEAYHIGLREGRELEKAHLLSLILSLPEMQDEDFETFADDEMEKDFRNIGVKHRNTLRSQLRQRLSQLEEEI